MSDIENFINFLNKEESNTSKKRKSPEKLEHAEIIQSLHNGAFKILQEFSQVFNNNSLW